MTDRAWYVVMCGGNAGFFEKRRVIAEFKAVERIGDEGYEAFCPTRAEFKRVWSADLKRRVTKRLIWPLWDGYLFARLDARALNRRLPAWSEVYDIIRRDGEPMALGDGVIASLRKLDQIIEAYDITGTPEKVVKRAIAVGDTIEHRAGALAGVVGRVTEVDGDNIRFVWNLLGTETKARARVEDVEVVA